MRRTWRSVDTEISPDAGYLNWRHLTVLAAAAITPLLPYSGWLQTRYPYLFAVQCLCIRQPPLDYLRIPFSIYVFKFIRAVVT